MAKEGRLTYVGKLCNSEALSSPMQTLPLGPDDVWVPPGPRLWCSKSISNSHSPKIVKTLLAPSSLSLPQTHTVPIITLVGRALAVTVNHQRRGQGPHAQSGPARDPIPADVSRQCLFEARKVFPFGGCEALGLGESSLAPPGGFPFSGEQGQRCSRAPPDGRPQPLWLPTAPDGNTPAGGTSMATEQWGPKQLEEKPRRQRCSPQHQGSQHRDSCFDKNLVPAPVQATSNMAAAARSKTPRTGWNYALPHGSGSPWPQSFSQLENEQTTIPRKLWNSCHNDCIFTGTQGILGNGVRTGGVARRQITRCGVAIKI